MNSRKSPGLQNRGTFLALLGLVLLAIALLAIIAMVLPGAFRFLAVLFGLFLFGAMHYLLWGWWLGVPKPGDDHDEDVGE